MELSKYTQFLESKLSEIELPEKPEGLYEPFSYFMNIGGKRIRPMLTLLSAEMFGAAKENVVSQAMAIEIFHNFTLVHDDIMDDAPVRRGVTTIHEKWNTNVAILSGDVMLIKAYQYLCEVEKEVLPELIRLFNKTAIEVCEGQQYDMDFEQRMDVTAHEYIEMIRLKTSVLLGCAMKTGAMCARASEEDQQSAYEFGQHIGVAFQIQDDILDLYGDPEKFGKQIGGDIIANKKTILYLTALQKANAQQISMLKQLHESEDNVLKVKRTKELFDHLKIKEECQLLMNDHYAKAMSALENISVSEDKKKPLRSLADYLMNREN